MIAAHDVLHDETVSELVDLQLMDGSLRLGVLFPNIDVSARLDLLVEDTRLSNAFVAHNLVIFDDIAVLSIGELAAWRNLGSRSLRLLLARLTTNALRPLPQISNRDIAPRPESTIASEEDRASAQPAEISTREQRIVMMRQQGATLAEIGVAFGISRERSRQIIAQGGGPDVAAVRATRSAERQAEISALRARIDRVLRALLTSEGPTTPSDAAERLGIDESQLAAHWPPDLEYLRLREGTRVTLTWTDAAILDAVRNAAMYDFPLTTSAYADLVRVGQVKGPSLPRIIQRFGTWTEACDAAGVEHGSTRRGTYESRWTDADILDYAREYFLNPDWPDSAHGYDRWRLANAPDAPSQQTIRVRIGRWSDVKRQALSPRNPT